MAQKWQEEDLAQIALFTAEEFKSWLIGGLINCYEGEAYLAFAPLQNSFCTFQDNIAEQLVEMATSLPSASLVVFIEGLDLGLKSLGEEHELYVALKNILNETQKPRALAA